MNAKAHEPGEATTLKSEEMLGPGAVQFTGRYRRAYAIGVSRKVRLGFRRALRSTPASRAGAMPRRGFVDRASRACQNLAGTLQVVLSVD